MNRLIEERERLSLLECEAKIKFLLEDLNFLHVY